MKQTIKVYDITHAVECVFADNLNIEFEQEFGEIVDGGCYDQHIKDNNITLEDIVNFLDRQGDDEYVLAYPHWLDQVADDANLSVYQLWQKTSIKKSTFYDLKKKDIQLLNLSGTEEIAIAVGMAIEDFITKYYNKKEPRN